MSDLARQYPPGKELAIGGQTGGLPEVPGREKATAVNAVLVHGQPNGQELAR